MDGYTLAEVLGGSPSKSGQNVNNDNSLTLSSVWRAIQVLGGASSSIPFKVYKKTSTGREEVGVNDHPVARMLTRRPNKKVTSKVWMDRAVNHLHMRGNHYALIVRNELGQAVELQMWNPDTVEVYEDLNEVFYKRKGDDKTYRSSEVIHVPHLGDGVVGKSTIKYAKEDLGLEMSRRDYGSGVYASGARPPALLKPATNLTDPQRVQAQKSWDAAKKPGRDVLLPFGFDYVPLAFKPEEVEFLQSGNFSISTIARWFGVPPHKLYDLERSTFSNIEHMAIEFLQDTMTPILVKFEAEYTDKLFQLTVEEKRGYYCKFNMNAYVRADINARYSAYATGVHAAIIKPSEARELEEMEYVKESDRLFINQGSAPLDLIDQIALKKTPVSAAAKDALKAKFNGQTQEILDILND